MIGNIKSLFMIPLLLMAINMCTLNLECAKKCERTIETPIMVDPSKESEKIWQDRLKEIDEALKNIEKKIEGPE